MSVAHRQLQALQCFLFKNSMNIFHEVLCLPFSLSLVSNHSGWFFLCLYLQLYIPLVVCVNKTAYVGYKNLVSTMTMVQSEGVGTVLQLYQSLFGSRWFRRETEEKQKK